MSESESARRIGISRQNLNAWRIRGVRQLPARTTLQGVADVLGCHYYVVLEAALRDSDYLDPVDRIVAIDRTREALSWLFIHAIGVGFRTSISWFLSEKPNQADTEGKYPVERYAEWGIPSRRACEFSEIPIAVME